MVINRDQFLVAEDQLIELSNPNLILVFTKGGGIDLSLTNRVDSFGFKSAFNLADGTAENLNCASQN